ncbi:hypothetical protein HYQ45_010782 [Verticillium longisporum]|uniref:Uncharacterized protein n=1 Tax=Verticillium longisporum TaxID=100787 RepID=A0A0G4NJM4_VERLO|nr:hypothetical protein HYQ44_002022 [Verticillium longisporum]KAG7130347.1 hypothetical protein HYQ45_010782 [Verticillium longisporum]CRK10498.1 hypothetical protein BN1708_009925 [Verticillium longisporum]CRK46586.1 hypothetical protein BN1723_007144 [Verticillium longisporum]
MKFSSLFLPAVFVSAVYGNGFVERRATKQCNPGNNCQRGVGGTAGVRPPLTSRQADCSRLNVVTVSPSTTTTTLTTTVTIVNIPNPTSFKRAVTLPTAEVAKRQDVGAATITPTSVPTYATYCSSASAYYSACSCACITAVTITLPTPTATTYSTVSVCAAMNLARRALEGFGYEVEPDFDAIKYPGFRLI